MGSLVIKAILHQEIYHHTVILYQNLRKSQIKPEVYLSVQNHVLERYQNPNTLLCKE